MKRRLGFVANSSSSSFVVLRTEKLDDKTWKALCDEIAAVKLRYSYEMFSNEKLIQGFSEDYQGMPTVIGDIFRKYKLIQEYFKRCLQ